MAGQKTKTPTDSMTITILVRDTTNNLPQAFFIHPSASAVCKKSCLDRKST